MNNSVNFTQKNRVLVAGATGLVGNFLCDFLSKNGYEVAVLSRNKKANSNFETFVWNVDKKQIDEALFSKKIDYIINLAGAGIADQKWSDSRKSEIILSRTQSSALLADFIKKTEIKPQAFISAAAIGIYGNRGEEVIDEHSMIRKDSAEFLVQSCIKWEEAADEIAEMGIRTVKTRIGIVLSTKGGALAKMLPSYKFGIGTYFGNGKQFYSWVHIEDLCRIFLHLIQDVNSSGVFNAVSPNPVRNHEFAAKIAEARASRALLIPIPSFAMKLAMGEMSAIVLDSVKVHPNRLLADGFQFQYPELTAALKDIIVNKK
jgi:uncharacterized protein